jgi:dTDP-4-amino-4,6-dideoxygalactose transaminase/GT2 family glycosyltransferase
VIPLVDLAAQRAAVAEEVSHGWQRVLAANTFISGPEVQAFEQAFASFSATRHCIGVGNGTDAIEIALRAFGVGPGGECILPANTFVGTAEAVCRTGAKPVLVDCAGDDTYLAEIGAIGAAVTRRTRAIIPVHLYGQAAPVERLLPLADRIGACVVEDAAQAQGARRNAAFAGSLGHAAATSFYPGKNLGAYGDAGAVLTESDDIAARVRMIRDHGSPRKYQHEVVGVNSRLDSLQAVVLSAKLRRLAGWNAARREAAARYDALLSGVADVIRPRTLKGNDHVWHLYVVRVPNRDRVLEELHAAGIGAGIHYPVPIHLTPAFTWLGYSEGAFPNAEGAAGQVLSLPLFPEITAAQQERVVSALAAAVSGRRTRAGTGRAGSGHNALRNADCGIIIVSYNSGRHIDKLLDSLPAATRGLRTRCLVVDNDSDDDTSSIVRSRDHVLVTEAGRNLGYAGAINLGRSLIGPCSSLLILNPDLVLEPGAVVRLYRALDRPGAGVTVPTLLDREGGLYPSLRREPSLTRALGDALFGSRWPRRPGWLSDTIRDPAAYQRPGEVAWAGGAALLISAPCHDAVGDWDDGRFFLYSEETDFAARARRCGYRIRYVPAARARHEGGGSGRSPALGALMAVNRIRYYEKYHRRPATCLFRALVALHHLGRFARPDHRVALRAVIQRSRWPALPGGDAIGAASIPTPAEHLYVRRGLRRAGRLA